MNRYIVNEGELLKIVDGEGIKAEVLKEQGYQYAWIQRIASVSIGDIKGDVELDDLIEARFFNENKEMHFFFDGEKLCAVETSLEDSETEGDGKVFDEKQMLRERFGKSVTIRSYIDYDEDGQAYVAYSALAGYERR